MKKCFLIHVFNFFFLNYICFWIIDCLHFQLGKVFPNCSPKCLYQFTSQQKVRLFHCPISLPTHEIARLRLTNLMHVLICIYLITRVRLSIFFFLLHFLLDYLSLIYKSNICFLNTNLLFSICYNYLLPDCSFPFSFVYGIFYQTEVLYLECSNLLGFSFIICAFDVTFK